MSGNTSKSESNALNTGTPRVKLEIWMMQMKLHKEFSTSLVYASTY